MDRVADFKPIGRLSLPGLGELSCTGLTVVIGPNSSGRPSTFCVILRSRETGGSMVPSTALVEISTAPPACVWGEPTTGRLDCDHLDRARTVSGTGAA